MKKFRIRNLCIFTLSLLMIFSFFIHSSSALTSSAQTQSKPVQTQQGRKRAYSELKGLWISEDVLNPYTPYRRELIQFANDKQKTFAVSTLSGSVTAGDTKVNIVLKGFKQVSNDSFELVYKTMYRNDVFNIDPWENEYTCRVQWIDDNTIELVNYPFSDFTESGDGEGNTPEPVPHRYTRIAKSRIPVFSYALQSMNAYDRPENWEWSVGEEDNEAKRAQYLNYLEPTDKKILEAIEKDYKEIYKNKGKYKNIRLEVLIALEQIAG